MNEQANVWRGFIATITTSGMVVFSTLEGVKAWLQVLSLLASLIIGVLTIITMVRNLRRKDRD